MRGGVVDTAQISSRAATSNALPSALFLNDNALTLAPLSAADGANGDVAALRLHGAAPPPGWWL
jgi:hypothetical protein